MNDSTKKKLSLVCINSPSEKERDIARNFLADAEIVESNQDEEALDILEKEASKWLNTEEVASTLSVIHLIKQTNIGPE